MSPSLPERASLEWLRKTAKQRLRQMRAAGQKAQLADAQLAVAREHGFSSWRSLKDQIEQNRRVTLLTIDSDIASFLRKIAAGSLDEVRSTLAKSRELIHSKGPHPHWGGQPQPIHVAVESGNLEMVQLVLDAGADPNGDSSSYDGWSPLMLATDKPEIRALLLRSGARVGLVEALMMGDDAMTAELLSSGTLPETAPNNGSILAFARTSLAIERLVELGASTTARDRWGVAPVQALSQLGARGAHLVKQLMQHGAAANAADYAAMGERLTLENLADADPSILRDDDVLMAAVKGRHVEIAKWLLKSGANARARLKDLSRHSALHTAAWNGDLEMVRLLVEFGADPTERDAEYDATPLGWAHTSIEVTRNTGLGEVIAFLAKIEEERSEIQSKKS